MNDTSPVEKPVFTLSGAFKKMGDKVQESFGSLAETFNDNVSTVSETSKMEIRESVPRMPWNDVHASVSGSAARDVASHIVQVRELCDVCEHSFHFLSPLLFVYC